MSVETKNDSNSGLVAESVALNSSFRSTRDTLPKLEMRSQFDSSPDFNQNQLAVSNWDDRVEYQDPQCKLHLEQLKQQHKTEVQWRAFFLLPTKDVLLHDRPNMLSGFG